jgi:hypothetical protein
MAQILSCYYLDEPLNEAELLFVRQTLLGPWAKFWTGATTLVQRRVPLVVPAPGPHGYALSREQRAQNIRRNLRRAGIQSDVGRQVVWVTPDNNDWDAVFQFAIRLETMFAPFVVQRNFGEPGRTIGRQPRVIDTHMLMRGL